MIQVFDFNDYKSFVKKALQVRDQTVKGSRSALAKFIGCQNAYVSHVLNGHNDFSLEQGDGISEFLSLSEAERHFFFLLLQRDRAGKANLKKYFTEQIEAILSERRAVQNRLGMQSQLSAEHQILYYSDWLPAAVHMLLLNPDLQSAERLAERLRVPVVQIQRTMEFLETAGLIDRSDKKIRINLQWVYLPTGSPLIRQHHTNWRLRAMQTFDPHVTDNLNHSGVISISKADAGKIREVLLQALNAAKVIVSDSKDEDIFGLNIDFFRI